MPSNPLPNTGNKPIFSTKGRVKKNNPCPICGHTTWCSISDCCYFVICMRPSKAGSALGWQYVKDTENGGKEYVSTALTPIGQTKAPAPAIQLEGDKSTGHGGVERAEPALLHQVYSDLMRALPLHNRHLKTLLDPKGKRRLTMADIAAMGLRSLPESQDELNKILGQLAGRHGIETLLKVPGFYLDKQNNLCLATGAVKGMLIPSYNGRQVSGLRVYPDKPLPKLKYYWLTSATKQGPSAQAKASIYQPLQANNNATRPGVTGVTEGEFKAHIAAQYLGYPVISTPGTQSWKSAGVVEAAVELAGLGGRVVVFYDMESNKDTDRARLALAESLSGAGLRVELASWDITHKGIDESLMAGGTFTTSNYVPAWAGVVVNTVLAERYVPDLTLSKRVTLLQSGKNTGKTTYVKRVIDTLKARNQGKTRIMSITHRVLLGKVQAEKWGMDFYQEYDRPATATHKRRNLAESQVLTICANSLPKLDTRKIKEGIDLLIFDEIEQLLQHLTGPTIKDSRQAVFATLEYLIRHAKQIICLDADLSRDCYNFFVGLLGAENVEVIVNMARPPARTFLAYDKKPELIDELKSQLGAGKKCFVAHNSLAGANQLFRVLKTTYPEKKGWLICSETVGKEEIHKDIENINEVIGQYDYVVASPSLGTGVSIDYPGIDSVFLLGEIGVKGINTHKDLLQQAGRVRKPISGQVHCWISPKKFNRPVDPEIIKRQELESLKETAAHIQIDDLGVRTAKPHEQMFLNLWADIKASRNSSWLDLRGNFYRQAELEGNTVRAAGVPAGENLAIIKSELAHAKEEIDTERCTAILAAPDISESEFERLDNEAYKDVVEKAKLDRHSMQKFYGLPVDKELVELDNKGRTRQKVLNFIAIIDPDYAPSRDRKVMEQYGPLLPDVPKLTIKTKMRKEILSRAGLAGNLFGEFEAITLKNRGFSAWVVAESERIERVLDISIRSDIESNPVQFLATVLGQLGLELAATRYRTGEKKLDKRGRLIPVLERRYKLNKESFKTIQSLAEAHQAATAGHGSTGIRAA